MDVNALDTWGVPRDLRTSVEIAAIENVKRLARPPRGADERFDWLDDRRAQRPRGDCRLPRDQDRLAPDRDVGAAPVASRPELPQFAICARLPIVDTPRLEGAA